MSEENTIEQDYIIAGEKLYRHCLYGRSGFDMDLDEDIWKEIYREIGEYVTSLTCMTIHELQYRNHLTIHED